MGRALTVPGGFRPTRSGETPIEPTQIVETHTEVIPRKQAASLLGLSVPGIIRWERIGRVTKKVDRHGRTVYEASEIRRLRVMRGLPDEQLSPDMVLQVIALFGQGMSPFRVLVQLGGISGVTQRTVTEVWEEWKKTELLAWGKRALDTFKREPEKDIEPEGGWFLRPVADSWFDAAARAGLSHKESRTLWKEIHAGVTRDIELTEEERTELAYKQARAFAAVARTARRPKGKKK